MEQPGWFLVVLFDGDLGEVGRGQCEAVLRLGVVGSFGRGGVSLVDESFERGAILRVARFFQWSGGCSGSQEGGEE